MPKAIAYAYGTIHMYFTIILWPVVIYFILLLFAEIFMTIPIRSFGSRFSSSILLEHFGWIEQNGWHYMHHNNHNIIIIRMLKKTKMLLLCIWDNYILIDAAAPSSQQSGTMNRVSNPSEWWWSLFQHFHVCLAYVFRIHTILIQKCWHKIAPISNNYHSTFDEFEISDGNVAAFSMGMPCHDYLDENMKAHTCMWNVHSWSREKNMRWWHHMCWMMLVHRTHLFVDNPTGQFECIQSS